MKDTISCSDCGATVPVGDARAVEQVVTEEVVVEASPYHHMDPRHNPTTREEPVGTTRVPVCPDCRGEEDPRTDGGGVNPPRGDLTDTPFTGDEIRDLIRGAELLRYTPGYGEHEGNVMAVFETPDGEEIGLTFVADPSTYPDDLIGETVREKRPFVRGSGTAHGKAFVYFADRDPATEKIIIRNTRAVGVYGVDA